MLARWRYAAFAFIACCGAVLAGGRGDWDFFVEVGRSMFSSTGRDVFSAHPDAQTGPATLALAAILSLTPRNGFVLAVVACGALGVSCVRQLDRRPVRTLATDPPLDLLVGGLLLAMWWTPLGAYGHLDDALVLTAVLAATHRHQDRRRLAVGLLIGLGSLVKPWALCFLPLCWIPAAGARFGRPRRADLAAGALAVGIAAAGWAPFLIGVPLRSGGFAPSVLLADDSVIALLGWSTAPASAWYRIAQLALIATGVLLAVAFRRTIGALLVGVALRVLTDPAAWPYYSAGVALGALAWDLDHPARRWPRTTAIATVAVMPDALLPDAHMRAAVRLAGCTFLIVTVLADRRHRR